MSHGAFRMEAAFSTWQLGETAYQFKSLETLDSCPGLASVKAIAIANVASGYGSAQKRANKSKRIQIEAPGASKPRIQQTSLYNLQIGKRLY